MVNYSKAMANYKAPSTDNYDEGHALGIEHAQAGLVIALPIGFGPNWKRGYKDGHRSILGDASPL